MADTNLTGAVFRRARRVRAKLHSATATGADLTGADLTGAHIVNSDLAGAALSGTTPRRGVARPGGMDELGFRLARAGEGGDPRPRPCPATVEPAGSAYSVAFSPDGTLLAHAAGNAIVISDLRTGEPVENADRPHRRGVGRWRSRPDGRRLATAGDDGTVRLWDPATGADRAQP